MLRNYTLYMCQIVVHGLIKLLYFLTVLYD